MDRASRGDREKARTLLGEALETYTRIRMPRHIEMAQALSTLRQMTGWIAFRDRFAVKNRRTRL